MNDPDWAGVGENIVDGMIDGIKNKAGELAMVSANMAISALKSARYALGVKSPSKEFAKIGKFAVDGFAIGLQQVSGVISSSKKSW